MRTLLAGGLLLMLGCSGIQSESVIKEIPRVSYPAKHTVTVEAPGADIIALVIPMKNEQNILIDQTEPGEEPTMTKKYLPPGRYAIVAWYGERTFMYHFILKPSNER